ncbi:MAG: hypothetical protein WCY86_05045 [Spirosomataceae bacterium]
MNFIWDGKTTLHQRSKKGIGGLFNEKAEGKILASTNEDYDPTSGLRMAL